MSNPWEVEGGPPPSKHQPRAKPDRLGPALVALVLAAVLVAVVVLLVL